jgi:hypothetical protein
MQLPGTLHPCPITVAIESREEHIFFTVNSLEQRSRLLVEHIDAYREAVRQVRVRRLFLHEKGSMNMRRKALRFSALPMLEIERRGGSRPLSEILYENERLRHSAQSQ